ncbi:cytochrome ubiquinol oxidase subunit I [Siccirubricoccus sp. KC 17139]|uniref:Cytochrome ubiquinol oxidase subunit I n=1 Tax=Siccirubricoccus soli TaxID=2899147 RepID=A0ABT1DD72_9PROT|nr:cytochrome ubiquinol oxidase subunit I [Siccirubricoccus soli]MCO6419892.1 cytochrome ubiquinol oxidase subunit I [Siccirubricoccus soli]MCP2686027.1 cytochrome ubiquinol oxidase subunit I [Siccirubricoccus soli]
MPWDALPSALDLARFQFAFTVTFHFLFPAFTIGLASYLAVLEGLWLWTGRAAYLDLFRYWLKVFAVNFAMGVVSGIVMSYQFGTNWSVFSDRAGPILGPLLGYEVLTAFFLEAGFLGVMLFGLGRVGRGLHFAATCLVAIGTLISGFWILSANSWMQTPAGHGLDAEGRFIPLDWWAIVFNPSFPFRYLHTITGAYLTTAMIVGAVGAFHLLRNRANERARIMFSMAMWMAAAVAPAQLFFGDMQGLWALEHQPQKVAAMEGHWETHRGAPLILFGIPDMAREETRLTIEIPRLGSLILRHDWDGEILGLKAFPKEDRPTNVPLVFWSFRIMVGMGLLMIGLGFASLWLRLRRRLYETPWFLRWAVAMGPSGLIAVTFGWITTEAGRQPFTVYGLMRTAESVSPIAAPALAASLAAFVAVYFCVFGAGIWYLFRLFAHAPEAEERGAETEPPIRTAGITPAPQVPAAQVQP